MTCSVCIATYCRPQALRGCVEALAAQTEPPSEVVISDAGGDAQTAAVVDACRQLRGWDLRHCRTDRAALPWQRWWAFQHSTHQVALFLDDDVRLMPGALALLRRAYDTSSDAAGVGFPITYEGEDEYSNVRGMREYWLGIAKSVPGSVTPGGITVDLPTGQHAGALIEVQWMSGGAMSYRRDVLEAVGPLPYLYHLYDVRIGKAEDSVLSQHARRHGRLLLIPGRHAVHPPFRDATRTANPQDGFRKGLLETWGRAHVLRWLARDDTAAARAWMRVASLELARAARAVVRQPAARVRWQRVAGGMVGVGRTLRRWREIPEHPGYVSTEGHP